MENLHLRRSKTLQNGVFFFNREPFGHFHVPMGYYLCCPHVKFLTILNGESEVFSTFWIWHFDTNEFAPTVPIEKHDFCQLSYMVISVTSLKEKKKNKQMTSMLKSPWDHHKITMKKKNPPTAARLLGPSRSLGRRELPNPKKLLLFHPKKYIIYIYIYSYHIICICMLVIYNNIKIYIWETCQFWIHCFPFVRDGTWNISNYIMSNLN